MRRVLALAFAALLFFLSALPTLAQETPASPSAQQSSADEKKAKYDYALIFGTVWDQNNQPIYGVPIKIRRADQKKAKWQLISDHQGEFAQRVPVGTADYIITADIKVPKGSQKPEIKAHIESNERVDVSLHLTK